MKQLGSVKNLLICQKSKIDDWIEHFKNYYDFDVYNLTSKSELESYLSANPTRQCVGIINYELAFRRTELLSLEHFTLMLDESSMIQNETAKRSKFVLKLNPENVILLSGTPTAGKYENLWSQLHLLNWEITKKRYWQHYVEVEWIEDRRSGFKISHVVGYKNVDRLKAKLAEHGAVFMKSEEAFELPEQIEIPMMLNSTKEYRQFMRSSVVTVEGHELIGDTTLVKRLCARQLCGQYHKGKLQAFEDLILSTEDRLIVFYNFNAELDLIKEIALKKTQNLSFVNGSVKDLDAYEQHSDSITFVQYQAGAMGLNLQKANKAVYFTLPERSELFEQSKKRIHRIGQERSCFYYYLLCKNSVEMDVLNTLKMRKDYTDDLFENYTDSPE